MSDHPEIQRHHPELYRPTGDGGDEIVMQKDPEGGWCHIETAWALADDITRLTKENERLKAGIDAVLATFTSDEAAGYRSRDRQFAIEILQKAAQSA